MIIDGHAHACGDYLTASNIIKIMDENNVDKIVLVPGELNSTKNYFLPNLAGLFPHKDVVRFTNILTKIIISFVGAAKQIDAGNAYVFSLVNRHPDRIIQFFWLSMRNLPDESFRDRMKK